MLLILNINIANMLFMTRQRKESNSSGTRYSNVLKLLGSHKSSWGFNENTLQALKLCCFCLSLYLICILIYFYLVF